MANPPGILVKIVCGAASILLAGGLLCSATADSFDDSNSTSLNHLSIDKDDDRLRELVQQLSNDDFDVRDHAEKALIEFGVDALPFLEKTPDLADHDLRLRLSRIRSIIQSQQLQRQINDFLYNDQELPGWQQFRELVSDPENYREEYVEIFRSHSRQISKVEQDVASRVKSIRELFSQFDAQRNRSTRFDAKRLMAIAFLYSSLLDDRDAVPADLNQRIANTFMEAPLRDAFKRGDLKEPLFGFIRKWVELDDRSSNGISQRLMLAQIYELPEGVLPATACLKAEYSFMTQRRNALEMLATFGDAKHIPLIETFLNDDTFVNKIDMPEGRNRKTYTTQLGDVALAALVHLSGQEYGTFGIHLHDHFQTDTALLDFRNAGFTDEAARAQAIQRWRESRN